MPRVPLPAAIRSAIRRRRIRRHPTERRQQLMRRIMTAVVSIAEMLMRVTVLAVIVRRLVLKRAVDMVMPASKRRMQRRRRPDLRKHGPQLAANLIQQLRRQAGRGKPLLSTRILGPANQLTLPAASITPGLPRCTIRFRQSTGYNQGRPAP